ncbi:25349_t:CDS:2 [Dentiscutata erythropus]|uniref:cytochrome-b5 reductase n=1 Tax=Dentiscutata erythropus TaxID=1348616 RepID=A0A9N9DE38_9GLOM|nr:25349_t:CDS:2 [Dentiscutata erythropus]
MANTRLHSRIPEKIYALLPTHTWEEFNEKIFTGACLVVAEGLVFDINKWIRVHPGGQRILRRVIGTDITNDFFFDPNVQMSITKTFDKEDKLLNALPTEASLQDGNIPLKRKKIASYVPKSAAMTIDMINCVTFKNTRVAMHRHSKFATSRLATMIVGRIIDYEHEKFENPIIDGIIPYTNKTIEVPKIPAIVFRRYILINVEEVTRYDTENPVKKFTFQIIHPFDKLPKILPGDYIEVMSYSNKTTIVRQYTALKGPNENTFSIIVKIYKDGVMSQHLHRQLKNFEIAVRRPFDVSDRIVPTSSIIPNFEPTGLRYRSSTRHGTQTFSVVNSRLRPATATESESEKDSPTQPRLLMNHRRDDKCWDCLFLICGGTGITPGLQLIQYHLDQAEELSAEFKIHLLFSNNSIEDIISYNYLLYLQEQSDEKLTIDFVLTKAPPSWDGYVGHIDDNVLYHWMSNNYKIEQPPEISNISRSPTSYRNNYTSEIDFEDTSDDEEFGDTSLTRGHSIISNRGTNTRPPTSVLLKMHERQEYINLLTKDDSQELRVMVCGPQPMMDSIRISLGKLGFPDEKCLPSHQVSQVPKLKNDLYAL